MCYLSLCVVDRGVSCFIFVNFVLLIKKIIGYKQEIVMSSCKANLWLDYKNMTFQYIMASFD